MQAAPLLQFLLISQTVLPVVNLNAAELAMQPLTTQASIAIFKDKGLVIAFAQLLGA